MRRLNLVIKCYNPNLYINRAHFHNDMYKFWLVLHIHLVYFEFMRVIDAQRFSNSHSPQSHARTHISQALKSSSLRCALFYSQHYSLITKSEISFTFDAKYYTYFL